jgi:hypothetical protein
VNKRQGTVVLSFPECSTPVRAGDVCKPIREYIPFVLKISDNPDLMHFSGIRVLMEIRFKLGLFPE